MKRIKADAISESSPLYEYWKTEQDSSDELKRLLILNEESLAKQLFKYEPYKWENLYQSVVREISNGDISSIKGLNILLDTIKIEERNKVIRKLRDLSVFDDEIIELISINKSVNLLGVKKIFRFAKILFAIFTNPYGINLKRKKNHLYERTGSIIYFLKEEFSLNHLF